MRRNLGEVEETRAKNAVARARVSSKPRSHRVASTAHEQRNTARVSTQQVENGSLDERRNRGPV
jgi:hypothetical protein